MISLEYRVGGLSSNPTDPSKFIVHRDNKSTLGIYAQTEKLQHKYIAEHFGLKPENVLGGGKYEIESSTLVLKESSADFGSLPKEAAKRVGETLADYLRQRGVKITRVKNDMYSLDPQRTLNRKNAEIWKSLGFKLETK